MPRYAFLLHGLVWTYGVIPEGTPVEITRIRGDRAFIRCRESRDDVIEVPLANLQPDETAGAQARATEGLPSSAPVQNRDSHGAGSA